MLRFFKLLEGPQIFTDSFTRHIASINQSLSELKACSIENLAGNLKKLTESIDILDPTLNRKLHAEIPPRSIEIPTWEKTMKLYHDMMCNISQMTLLSTEDSLLSLLVIDISVLIE
jgi:hypothetical protein